MELKCLFGHKWDGCKCSRCSKVRDEQHDWNLCKGKCKRCSKTQPEQHVWNGCKCSHCGKVRDEQHDWNGCKCKHCGKTRDEQHDYVSCKCSRCDKENHTWEGKTCKVCGIAKPNRFKDMGREEGNEYINNMNATELMELILFGEDGEDAKDLSWLCSRMVGKLNIAKECDDMAMREPGNKNRLVIEKALHTFGGASALSHFRSITGFWHPTAAENVFTSTMLQFVQLPKEVRDIHKRLYIDNYKKS